MRYTLAQMRPTPTTIALIIAVGTSRQINSSIT